MEELEELTPWASKYYDNQMGTWAQRQIIALADMWWMCGGGKLWSNLPRKLRGVYARVKISTGVVVVHPDEEGSTNNTGSRQKKSVETFERTGGPQCHRATSESTR